ncbi:unnamed protein product [Adineta steineri]|uniref:VWFA domain-containing protein n=1 Tax=Adineta steineri TaxID=433720 RepID=A0A815KBU0_9BILA|nr:unnamed protein product [Adineta steineri]CAF1390800.1 unnamed protein product [Adineta steineri]
MNLYYRLLTIQSLFYSQLEQNYLFRMPKIRSQPTMLDSTIENNSTYQFKTVRKCCLSSEHEDIIPIPIQLFLWRQTSPFLKQKFGSLTDASSIIFDRVLVQNILHGLSPSLTDAISSIPKWLLIKAAFPHVMYACSSVIEHNIHIVQHQSISTIHPSLNVTPSASRSRLSTQLHVPFNFHNPTTILSTENPILLPRSSLSSSNHSLNSIDIRLFHTLHHLILYSNDQLLPLNTIQLFIYLFTPYINTYLHNNEKDFLSNSNLVQGMRLIWQPLFEYRQPNIRIFNTFIKPVVLSNDQQNQTSSTEHVNQCQRLSNESEPTTQRSLSDKQFLSHTIDRTSFIRSKSNIEKEQKSDIFIRTDSIISPTTSCNSINDLSSFGMNDNNMKIKAPIVHMSSIYSVSDLSRLTLSPQSPVADHFNMMCGIASRLSTTSASPPSRQPSDTSNNCSVSTPPISKIQTSEYLLLATYFDVGIIRTLFSPSWLTDGYLWCLEYLYKRIVDISDKILSDALINGILPVNILRFKSLSIPQMNIANKENYYIYLKKSHFNEQVTNDIIEQQSTMMMTPNLIKQPTTLLNIPFKYSYGKSLFNEKHNNFYQKINKIRYIDEDGIEHLDLANTGRYNHIGIPLSSSKHSRLYPSEAGSLLFQTSMTNSKDMNRSSTDIDCNIKKSSTNLYTMKTYSISDSEINYRYLSELKEVQSSSGYINRTGTINFSVVLAAIHSVICKEHHLKICELVINILDVLFGLSVISTTEDDMHRQYLLNNKDKNINVIDEKENEHLEEWLKQMDAKEDEKFQLAVDIILRILKRLGCSNCQSRGRNFNADQLRGKVRVSFNKLRLLNQNRFEKYFLNFAISGNLTHIFDILHALCDYCSETTVGLAHYTPYISTKSESNTRHTYANNFGNTHLSIGPKSIDGFILNIIFKPFITRLNIMGKSLLTADNMHLYIECRAFLMFMKENHGGIFRLTVFSSLIDPEKEIKIMRDSIKPRIDNKIRISFNHESSDDFNENIDQDLPRSNIKEEVSSINSKFKSVTLETVSLMEDDDHSLYEHPEENLYIDLTLIRMGLLRLNFMLESCPPGSVPDPQFLNSLLILDAPVLSKAAFLLECAQFVRRCSLGQWPEWMRMNITTHRLHETCYGRTSANANTKLTKLYQAAAAKMFYIWGDALSSQLESILDTEEKQNLAKDSWNYDETFDDYYNEAIINRSGHDCPYSLKLIVCLLLYEITSFLRETYETLPKLSSLSTTGIHNSRQQRTAHCQTTTDTSSTNIDKRPSDGLCMNSVASQISNRSTGSLFSSEQPAISSQMLSAAIVNMNPLVSMERHISFAVNTENDSMESNHTIIVVNDDDNLAVADINPALIQVPLRKTGSICSNTGKTKLIRKTSGKLRKPSMRLKDLAKTIHRTSFRIRSRSHVSNISSDGDVHQSNTGTSVLEPPDEYPVSPEDDIDQKNFDYFIKTRPFPWIKTVIRIFNSIQLTCNHEMKCLSTCYDKQTKSCSNLLKALLNMYQLSSLTSCSSSIQTHTKQSNKKREFSNYLFGEQTTDLPTEKEMNTYFKSSSTYIEKQVGSLMQIPLLILCKSSVLLEDEHYTQILRLSWELLLERNEELAACAATIVILTAARASHLVDTLIRTEMENSSALIRYNAILRFEILWRFRYQFWIRLEDGAHTMMKILPPSIEFVLPSAALGIANLQTVDPPWIPHVKTLVQQVALNQEEVRAVMTTSKTRKKHQQEFLHLALMTEETSKRVARENFIISTVPILPAASFEPLLHQTRDEEEEGHVDDDRLNETSIQLRQAQGTFPSAFSAAIFHLVDMLEDEDIIENGAAVSEAALQALWSCLLEDPTLLVRFFFEKLLHKERRLQSLQSLRRLIIFLTDIPCQFAHAIFNYVLGLLLSMSRSPIDGSQELFIAGLTLFWQIIPFVHGLILKDLKQILRKEQAEMMILITGNIPSTKKIIIHGPDASQIPTQAIISEDTQFTNVLQEALEFFGIPESKRDQYHLIDIKTQQIRIPDTYVRDFYFFRRNIYPQLSLVYMETKQSQRQLEQAAIQIKTIELSKVLFARYLLENTPFNQVHNCITFFHNEILKSPLFPRKQLESDFNLYTKISNKELFNVDMLHKYNWIKLIGCIFFNMDGKTSTTSDITLFLPIINGSFILHCEDSAMLRFCLATYINIVKHFRHIFATNGYLLIMPTFLRVYSNLQSNPMLKKSIEFCCKQFFILHRIPFLLQMLGSISQLFDFDERSDVISKNAIQSTALFRLLIALEQTKIDTIQDDYSILELVKIDPLTTKINNLLSTEIPPTTTTLGQGTVRTSTTIKSLDFCYADDDNTFTLLSCFDVCVTVVAYAPDSIRSLQMLGMIDVLLPKYLEYIKDRTLKNDIQRQGREEMKIIEKLSTAFKTLIHSLESLTRTFVEPKSDSSIGVHHKHPRASYCSSPIAPDEDSVSRFIDDRTKTRVQDADELKQVSEFRWPRHTLLSIMSNFIYLTTPRVKELIKLINDPTFRISELLDIKSHIRLADIAHTLLKLANFDPVTLSCHGIQDYFQKLIPCTDWNQEQLRLALNLLLRRIDRMFSKVCKKPLIKRCFDWEATVEILNGIYLTIDRHPSVAYFPNLKALISTCISLIINENISDSNQNMFRLDIPTFPKEFSRTIIKLVGRYLLAIKNQPNLEALVNQNFSSTNVLSTINHLLHFLLPLMFSASSGRKDAPKLHVLDISYIITILINTIKPPSKLAVTMGTQNGPSGQGTSSGRQHLTVTESNAPNSNLSHKTIRQLRDLLQTASLLGLKILIIGFGKHLKREWQRITQAIKSICNKQSNISSNLLLFIDFLVSYKTPIYLILRPFLMHYLHSVTSENSYDFEMITHIQQKIIFEKIPLAKSTGEILTELKKELYQLKVDLTDESKILASSDIRSISTGKVRFDMDAFEHMKDHDDITARLNTVSNIARASNVYRLRRQRFSDFSLNGSTKSRTEKIRLKDALDILETYQARYRTRCCGTDTPTKTTEDMTLKYLSSITDDKNRSMSVESSNFLSPSNSPMSIIYSEAASSDQNSPIMDSNNPTNEDNSDQSRINNQNASRLRIFRGWKRNAAHLEKTRSPKHAPQPQVPNESSIASNTTSVIKNLFQPIRQVSEQYSISNINEENSDFIDTSTTSMIPLKEMTSKQRESQLSTINDDDESKL